MMVCKIHGEGGMYAGGTRCSDCEIEKKKEIDNAIRFSFIENGKWNVPKRFALASSNKILGIHKMEQNESVLISGECGTGKTFYAVAMAKEYLKKHEIRTKDMDFLNFQSLAIDIKSSFGNSDISMAKLISSALCDFVVLDDIGSSGNPPPTTIDALYMITNRRYELELPTIYTTNMQLSEIAKTYGDRIASRLSACKQIKLSGSDRRLQK